jgi:hypothetical protein
VLVADDAFHQIADGNDADQPFAVHHLPASGSEDVLSSWRPGISAKSDSVNENCYSLDPPQCHP